MSGADQLMDLYQCVRQEVTEGSRLVDWAEGEIDKAMKRHPAGADRIFHAFPLLSSALSSQAWGTEFFAGATGRELGDDGHLCAREAGRPSSGRAEGGMVPARRRGPTAMSCWRQARGGLA